MKIKIPLSIIYLVLSQISAASQQSQSMGGPSTGQQVLSFTPPQQMPPMQSSLQQESFDQQPQSQSQQLHQLQPIISNALKPKACHTAYSSADILINQQVPLPGREEQALNAKVEEFASNGLIPPAQHKCPDTKEIRYVKVPVQEKYSSTSTSGSGSSFNQRSTEILPETQHSLPLPRPVQPIGVVSNGQFVMCNLNRLSQPIQNDPEALSSYLTDAQEPLKEGMSDCKMLEQPSLEVQEKIKQLKINDAIVADKLRDTTISDFDRYRLTAKQSQIKALEYQMSRCKNKSTMLDRGSVPLATARPLQNGEGKDLPVAQVSSNGGANRESVKDAQSIGGASREKNSVSGGLGAQEDDLPIKRQRQRSSTSGTTIRIRGLTPQEGQQGGGFFSQLAKSDVGKVGKIYAGNVAMNALMGGKTPFSTGALLTGVGAHNGGLGTSEGKGALNPAVMGVVQAHSNRTNRRRHGGRHGNRMMMMNGGGYGGNGYGGGYPMGGGAQGTMMMGGAGYQMQPGMMMGGVGGQIPQQGMPMTGGPIMMMGPNGIPQVQPLPGMLDPSLMPGLEMTPGLIKYEMNRRDRDAKAMIYDQDSANAMAVRQLNRAPNMIGNQMNQYYNQAIMNRSSNSGAGSVIRTPFGKIDGKLMYARQIEAMGSPVFLQTNPSLIYGEEETDMIRNQYKQAKKCRNAIY